MTPDFFMRRALGAVALLVACALPAAAAADKAPPAGAYLSGGIGNEEQASLQGSKAPYNLRLTFALSGSGEYVAGVNVLVERLDRKMAFGPYRDSGPLFFVRLDPGLYRVSATYEGVTRTRTVRIAASAIEDTFYWP